MSEDPETEFLNNNRHHDMSAIHQHQIIIHLSSSAILSFSHSLSQHNQDSPQNSIHMDIIIDELHCDHKDGFNEIDSMASHPDTSIDLNTIIDLSNSDAVPTASIKAQDSQNSLIQIINNCECDSTPAHIVVEQPVSRTTSALIKNSEIQNEYPPASPSKIQKECHSSNVEIINDDNTLLLNTDYEFLDKMTQLRSEPQISDKNNTEQVDPAELIKPGRF
ncbi:conserved hypothetical protein [Coccidioides posadasii str. Silveira]|uniref:Uncharacterized protein n=1 Tax=Coccidioides posadasii (strain RMSCC 757 / Silveira) TaxID=443226 RepID=E9D750_COCPS|nr:conserved hypothetical protein [Coccidioides posadasii str. Silveira]